MPTVATKRSINSFMVPSTLPALTAACRYLEHHALEITSAVFQNV
jgi:hypothetical protein